MYTFLPVSSIGEQQCVALIKLQYFIRNRLAVRSLCHFSYHVYVVAPHLVSCCYHHTHTHTEQTTKNSISTVYSMSQLLVTPEVMKHAEVVMIHALAQCRKAC